MELKSAINIILKDLEDARDLIDDLRNYPGVPLIQIELARSKCRSAADVIKLLSTLLEEMTDASVVNLQPEVASEAATGNQIEKPEVTSEAASLGQQPEIAGVITDKEEMTPKNSADETSAAENNAPETNVTEVSAKSPPSVEPDKDIPLKPDKEKLKNVIDEIIGIRSDESADETEPLKGKEAPKIVADRFSHLSERINEQIGDSRNGGQELVRVKKQITDITKEIGINDRFFLIKELFGGSREKYSAALNELNNVTSDEEAKRIIENYRIPSGDKEAGKMLSELVKRKLSSSNG